MMFAWMKALLPVSRSTHGAEIARLMDDVAVAQAEVNRMAAEVKKARADRTVSEDLLQEERKARRIAEVRHAAALQSVTAERDALRDAAAARRAKQLANLRNQKRATAAEMTDAGVA